MNSTRKLQQSAACPFTGRRNWSIQANSCQLETARASGNAMSAAEGSVVLSFVAAELRDATADLVATVPTPSLGNGGYATVLAGEVNSGGGKRAQEGENDGCGF